jgi:hypothetical protein
MELEAGRILASHEGAAARTITLEDSYKRLDELSLTQDELFRESLRAIEVGLFRAAHVLAWAGFIDFLHHSLADGGMTQLKGLRPKWGLGNSDDLREHADYQVIELGRAANSFTKTVMKALHGLLNKRNECAHPSDYYPDLNETLGYVSELFSRIPSIKPL